MIFSLAITMILLYAALAYMTGIALGRLWWDWAGLRCALPSWLWLTPLVGLAAVPLLRRLPAPWQNTAPLRWPEAAGFLRPASGPHPALMVVLALCAAAGMLRYLGQPFTPCLGPDELAYYNLPATAAFDRAAPQVTIVGYVDSYPQVADTKQELTIQAHAVEVDGVTHEVTGAARLKTGIARRYEYGQPVRVTGRLVTPPELDGFSYREYLARKGIHSLVYSPKLQTVAGPPWGGPLLRALYGLRARGEGFLNRGLPEPYAALANGMLLGIEAGIPDELYEQFNATATSHVIVISGSNVALIAGLIGAAAVRIAGRKRAVWPTVAGIGCYALLVGGDAAVLRAAVMGSLVVVATALDRRSTALVSLAAACALMTLLNPLALWDVGLQLSSGATAGLILFVPVLTAWSRRGFARLPLPARWLAPAQSYLEDGLLVTVAANLMTLPLVFHNFGRLSTVSLVTNLLIAPVQALIMLWGTAAVSLGAAGLEPVGRVVLAVPWLALTWTVAMVRWTASWPGASLEVGYFGAPALALSYAGLLGLRWRGQVQRAAGTLLGWLRSDLLFRVVSPVALGGLAMGAALVWAVVLAQPDGRLHVWFLDIGQGDGVLIQTPRGRQVLVDGGASPERLFNELGAVMPFWDRDLDLLVLTHPDGDHMAAQVEIPSRFRVAAAVDTAASQANPDAQPWRDRMAASGATVHLQHAGGWVDLGDGVALWVVWPPPAGYRGDDPDNENSLVTRLVYGNVSVLLTGDAGKPAEAGMLTAGAPVGSTVLKAGHHGSTSSSSPAFVAAVNPAWAVIQVGADNDYGHPSPETLEILRGRAVLRNDTQGRIHLATDGERVWVLAGQGSVPLASQ